MPTGEELREGLMRAVLATPTRSGFPDNRAFHIDKAQGNAPGFLDVLALVFPPLTPGVWALEAKSRGERLRPEQVAWLAQWEALAGLFPNAVFPGVLMPQNAVSVARAMGLHGLANEWHEMGCGTNPFGRAVELTPEDRLRREIETHGGTAAESNEAMQYGGAAGLRALLRSLQGRRGG